MDANYLAMNDGSIESAGRGMGADVKERKNFAPAIPYMQMTYAPLERRLDTAVFRAMFASSIRQARQFVVHGAVTVNGKKVCRRLSSTRMGIHHKMTDSFAIARCNFPDIYSTQAIFSKSLQKESCSQQANRKRAQPKSKRKNK